MSPGLSKVVERAKREPGARFDSLAHHLDEAALKRAFARIRQGAAAGVDGMNTVKYAKHQDENIRDLHQRLRTQKYRSDACTSPRAGVEGEPPDRYLDHRG